MELRRLGKTDLQLSPLGLGTWQFSSGNGVGAKYWQNIPFPDMKEIVRLSLAKGINWIDTAEAYGKGSSEKNIGNIIKELAQENIPTPYIADKWWPLARRAKSITQTIDTRLNLLQMNKIDLYQIHHPTSVSSLEKQLAAMCELVYQQKIKYVGVSNFSAKQMAQAQRYLEDTGASLVSNQVCYNLVNRKIESNGILETAKKLGISIIAYSPLQQGLLTGKFHDNPQLLKNIFLLRKIQYGLTEGNLKKTQNLINTLKDLALKYQCTPAQIALNWLIYAHGETVFAIPGASKIHHVEQNIGALDFKLTSAEITELNHS